MKKIVGIITTFFVGLLAFAPAPLALAADDDVQQKNEAAMADSADAFDEFWTFMEKRADDTSEQYYKDFAVQSEKTEQKLAAAAASFSTKDQSADTAKAVLAMQQAMTHAQKALHDWREAYNSNDLAAGDKAYTALNNSIDEYNAAYDDYSKAAYGLTDRQYQMLYISLAAGTAALAAGTWIWALNRNKKDTAKTKKSQELRAQRKAVARDSLWPVAGAGITLFTYYVPFGDTYFVLWGAIVFGLLFYFRSVFVYRRLVKSGGPQKTAA